MADEHQTRLRNRIKVLYEVIDSQNWKKANKLCKELNDEFPKAPLAKAATAVVYVRQNRPDEAMKVLEPLLGKSNEWILEVHTQHNVLQALRSLGRADLVEKIFETAWSSFKGNVAVNVNLGCGLFAAYLRSKNYLKQKMHAVAMFNELKDPQYLVWSIVSTALPVDKEGPGDMNLMVAEKMMERFLEQHKAKHQEDVNVYIGLMKQQHKYAEALAVIQSELGNHYQIEHQKLTETAMLLRKVEKDAEAQAIYKKLLDEINSDEWSWYMGYFDCMFKLQPTISDEAIAKTVAWLQSLQEKTFADKSKYRGPFLAEFEFRKRLISSNKTEFPVELFKIYFEKFGTKSAFFRDVAQYLKLVSTGSLQQVVDSLKPLAPAVDETADQAAKIDAVYKLCSFAAVERVVSLRLKTNTAPAARAAELMKPYHIIRALNITKETTERLPGDDLVVLAAHYLIDAYRAASDASDRSAFLLDAAAIYDAAKLIQRTKYFHEDNKRNTPDWMLEAFKHNKYSKVKEVEKFKERLESSRQLLVVRLEDIFVKLAKEAHSVTATKEAIHDGTANFELPSKVDEITALRLNNDTDVFDWYNLDEPINKDICIAYEGKTGAFFDDSQPLRILAESQLIQVIREVINVDWKAVSDDTKVKVTDKVNALQVTLKELGVLGDGADAKSPTGKLWQLVFTILDGFITISDALTSLTKDVVTDTVVNKTKETLDGAAELLTDLFGDVAKNPVENIPQLSLLTTRALTVLTLLTPLLAQLFPAKVRPKSPEAVKIAHGDLRTSLRKLINAIKDTMTKADALVSKSAPEPFAAVEKLAVAGAIPSADESKKLVAHVTKETAASIKDSFVSLSLVLKDKSKEFSQVKV